MPTTVTVPAVDAPDTREEREILRIGEEALDAVRQTFDNWMSVARALDLGRVRAMAETGANDIQDRHYQKAFSRWLDKHPKFNDRAGLPRVTRMWLLRCYDYQGDILAWRRSRGAEELVKYNFPETVFKRWARAERPELLSELERQGRRKPKAQPEAAAAHGIAESVQDLRGVVDDVVAATGGARALTFDLSDEHYGESVGNFVSIYGAQYGDPAVARFARALLAVVEPAPAVLDGPVLDPTFSGSLKTAPRRSRKRQTAEPEGAADPGDKPTPADPQPRKPSPRRVKLDDLDALYDTYARPGELKVDFVRRYCAEHEAEKEAKAQAKTERAAAKEKQLQDFYEKLPAPPSPVANPVRRQSREIVAYEGGTPRLERRYGVPVLSLPERLEPKLTKRSRKRQTAPKAERHWDEA